MTKRQQNKLKKELKQLRKKRGELAQFVCTSVSNIGYGTSTDDKGEMEELASEASGLASDAGRLSEVLSRIEYIDEELHSCKREWGD